MTRVLGEGGEEWREFAGLAVAAGLLLSLRLLGCWRLGYFGSVVRTKYIPNAFSGSVSLKSGRRQRNNNLVLGFLFFFIFNFIFKFFIIIKKKNLFLFLVLVFS